MKQRLLPFLFVVWGVLVGGGAIGWAKPSATVEPATSKFELPATDEGLPGEGPFRREDWFQSNWRDRRSHFESRSNLDQHALVFLGDSITEGWGDDIRGAFPTLKAANRGIGGDTTRGILARLDEDVLSLDPSGVVMLIGTNDLDVKSEPATIVGNIERIVDQITAHNAETPVVICQVFPSSAEKNRPGEKIREVNRLIVKEMAEEPQVTVLDTYKLFANAEGDAKVEEFPDLLHPNEAGYAKWAAALRPVLATLGYLDVEPDNFTLEPGFESLFNGHDLTGWGFHVSSEDDIRASKQPNGPARTIVETAITFDGQIATPDGRYVAKNGRLIVTTPHEGRRLQQMWTTREFPHDFVLKLEFRATPNADSGVYIRKPQLQCRDYLLAGPYTKLEKYKPQEWNELEVTVSGKVAHCTCNGEVLEDKLAVPETGPIGLEGDRGQMEYRRIRVHENP